MSTKVGAAMSHRMHIFAVFLLVALLHPQSANAQSTAAPSCAGQKNVPDSYYEAVLSRIRPPEWKNSLVRIIVGRETKLALWTDGEKFKLWTNNVDMKGQSIGDLLHRLAESCHLPADPAAATALIKVNWESSEISSTQFAAIHQEFIQAASRYVAKAQDRYRPMMQTRLTVVRLDSEGYSIEYDNSYEHIELEAWNSDGELMNPLIRWVHSVRKLAEENFHRAIWKGKSR